MPAGGILKRPIHSSAERLPVIGLGTYQSFGVGKDAAERKPLKQVLELFTEYGGSAIDSSPMYGTSEQVIGDLSNELALRPKLFMATKVWTSGNDAGVAQMNESFQKMRVSVMDLMQIHNLVLVAIAFEQLAQLVLRNAPKHRGVSDLVAVEMQDRNNRAVPRRVDELVGMPARREGTGLRLAVADNAEDDEVRVVQGGAVGVGEGVAEFTAFVD